MSLTLYPSKSDRMVFVSSTDTAVDVSTPELIAEYIQYQKHHHDVGKLKLIGDPVRFIMRPFDLPTYELAMREVDGIAVPGWQDFPAARQIFQAFCDDVENPPEDWKGELHEVWYGRRRLKTKFASQVSSGLCREAADMVLSTMPIPEKDEDSGPSKDIITEDAGTKKK